MVASAILSAALVAAAQLVPSQALVDIEALKARAGLPASGRASTQPTGGATAVGSATGSKKVNTSKSSCFSFSFGYSEAENKEAIVKSVKEVSAYVCDPGPEDEAYAAAVASSTAKAFAKAVATASVGCGAEGNVHVYAKAYAKATAAADLWLEAYADATASAGDCNKCAAFANSWGYVKEYVFLKAVAESQATVSGYTQAAGPKFFQLATKFNEDVQEAAATAFAIAIAGAKKYYGGNECQAWVNTKGCIYTPAQPEKTCFECEALSIGSSNVTAVDAIATASAAAAAYTCGNDTTAEGEAYVAASAIAEATAEALSIAYASCSSGNGSYSCSTSLAAVEDSANAVAFAFAEAWAGSYTCDDTCTVESEAAVYAIGDILVTAASDALAALCAGEGEVWTVGVLAESIESASLEALATAVAQAVSGGDECFAAAAVSAGAH